MSSILVKVGVKEDAFIMDYTVGTTTIEASTSIRKLEDWLTLVVELSTTIRYSLGFINDTKRETMPITQATFVALPAILAPIIKENRIPTMGNLASLAKDEDIKIIEPATSKPDELAVKQVVKDLGRAIPGSDIPYKLVYMYAYNNYTGYQECIDDVITHHNPDSHTKLAAVGIEDVDTEESYDQTIFDSYTMAHHIPNIDVAIFVNYHLRTEVSIEDYTFDFDDLDAIIQLVSQLYDDKISPDEFLGKIGQLYRTLHLQT